MIFPVTSSLTASLLFLRFSMYLKMPHFIFFFFSGLICYFSIWDIWCEFCLFSWEVLGLPIFSHIISHSIFFFFCHFRHIDGFPGMKGDIFPAASDFLLSQIFCTPPAAIPWWLYAWAFRSFLLRPELFLNAADARLFTYMAFSHWWHRYHYHAAFIDEALSISTTASPEIRRHGLMHAPILKLVVIHTFIFLGFSFHVTASWRKITFLLSLLIIFILNIIYSPPSK